MGVWSVREKMANPRASAPVSEGRPWGFAGFELWEAPALAPQPRPGEAVMDERGEML